MVQRFEDFDDVEDSDDILDGVVAYSKGRDVLDLRGRTRGAANTAAEVVPEGASHKVVSGPFEDQYVRVDSLERGTVRCFIKGGKRGGAEVFVDPRDLRNLDGSPVSVKALEESLKPITYKPPEKVVVFKNPKPPASTPVSKRKPRKNVRRREAENVPYAATHKIVGKGIYAGRYVKVIENNGPSKNPIVSIYMEDGVYDVVIDAPWKFLKELDF